MTSEYERILSRKNSFEKFGDNLQATAARAPNASAAQQQHNNIVSSFGNGVSMGAGGDREAKLAKLEEQERGLAMIDAELKMQLGKSELSTQRNAEFGKTYLSSIQALNESMGKTDDKSRHEFKERSKYLLQKMNPDELGGFNELDQVRDGNYYLKNNKTDEIKIVPIKEAVAGIIGTMSEENQRTMGNLTGDGLHQKFAREDRESNAKLEKLESEANNNNSQANHHNTQVDEIGNKIANPPMTETNKLNYTANKEHLDSLQKVITDKSIPLKIQVLDRLEEIIKQEGSAGGTPLKALQRWGKKIYGSDENLKEAELLQKYFFPDIKGVAGNPNGKEWDDLVKRIISTDQNVEAALGMIEFEKNQAQGLLDNYDDYSHVLSENPSQLHHHPDIRNQVITKAEARAEAKKKKDGGNKEKANIEKRIQWDT